MKPEINQLETQLNTLNSSLNEAKGKWSILTDQITRSEKKLEEFNHNKELYKKSVELLTVVEQGSKTAVIEGFETIVNFALSYILANDEYKLKVDCDRRGSLQTIDFNILTPGNEEPHKPGGFVTSILSLALRTALIEITKPKIEGFFILDEPFSAVDIFGNLGRAAQFLKKINNKIKRQMIVSSHHQEFIDIADKAIKIGGINE